MPDDNINVVFLGLGSNLGDRKKNIERACREIDKRVGRIISKSIFYVSDPEGFESENRFVNSVCELVTTLEASEVLRETQAIEKELGRTTKSSNGRYADRIIDIDILMVDNRIIEEPELIIPHPRFYLRNFVLTPFAEISPDTVHPVFAKTIQELKKGLENPGDV